MNLVFTGEELVLISDALKFWNERLNANYDHSPPSAYFIAGRHVVRRAEKLAKKLDETIEELRKEDKS